MPAGPGPPHADPDQAGPPLAFLTPAQSTCNYVTLFLRNISSVLSEHVSQGTCLRLVPVTIDDLPGP